MRFSLAVSLLVACVFAVAANAQADFQKYFIDRTMRVDYFHTGTKDKEQYSLDKVVVV